MVNTVEFPGLGLSFEVSRVAFTIFGINIYWYGVLIGIGMAIAVAFAFKKAGVFGLDIDRMIDVIFLGFIFAIVFGRLYYVLFVDAHYRTFFELIDLRSGGIAIYGGIIGAAVGAVIGCRWRKVPLLPMLDITSIGFLIGQCLGRWGNFFNQEAFGSNTTSRLGMRSQETIRYLTERAAWLTEHGQYVDPMMPVHPTFLYESVWCLIGFILLWRYIPKRKFNGEIGLFYIMWYGLGRAIIEGLRTDSLWLFGLVRVSQLLAILSALVAFGVWLWARRKNAGKPLVVPKPAPHTAVVKVPVGDGVQAVTISWPADQRAPAKEDRLELAKQILAEEQRQKDAETEKNGQDEDEGKKQAEAGNPKDTKNSPPGAEAREKAAEPKAEAADVKKAAKPQKGPKPAKVEEDRAETTLEDEKDAEEKPAPRAKKPPVPKAPVKKTGKLKTPAGGKTADGVEPEQVKGDAGAPAAPDETGREPKKQGRQKNAKAVVAEDESDGKP